MGISFSFWKLIDTHFRRENVYKVSSRHLLTVNLKPMNKRAMLACKLTSAELQVRKATVIRELRTLILSKAELPDGFLYQFASTTANAARVVSFIETESLCCAFFSFESWETDGKLWLRITGPEGAKEFLQDEVGF